MHECMHACHLCEYHHPHILNTCNKIHIAIRVNHTVRLALRPRPLHHPPFFPILVAVRSCKYSSLDCRLALTQQIITSNQLMNTTHHDAVKQPCPLPQIDNTARSSIGSSFELLRE